MCQNIWIVSDTHFSHNRSFLYEPRGFSTIEEHNEAIIENWNSIVKPSDLVYHLGDVMLNDNDAGLACLERLNGQIYIIRGNHDTETRVNLYHQARNVFDCGDWARVIKYNKYRFYLSHYPTICDNFDSDRPLKTRTIGLCGHSHCKDRFKDMNKGLIYHCELDAHDNKPVNIEEILADIKGYVQ